MPFPEIVVAAVETAATQNLGGDLARVRYAYGAAEQFFDFVADRFVFPGYGRRLELRVPTLTPTPLQQEGQLIVTDTWELAPFVASPKEERFGRYLRAGRTKDVTVVEGIFNLRVEQHLLIDVAVDGRRTSMSHYLWSPVVVEEPSVPSSGECFDVMHPYDWRATFVANATPPQLNVCTAHGFVYARSNDSWRGTVSPPSQNAVATRSEVWSIDRYARPLLIRHENDVNRGDDDFCVELQYPAPAGPNERVLSMLSSRRVTSCPGDSGPPVIWAAESWEYDGLAFGAIAKGLPTGHVVERRATSTGVLLNAVRTYDATYDLAANPVTVTTAREDGVQRTVTLDYDPFGLQVVRTRTNATGIPELQETITLDSLSLEPLTRTDANATQRGLEFDGFGRIIRATIKPPVGPLGVLSTTSYLGFSGVPPLARRVVATRYQDPVAPSAVGSAVGRVATGYFDEMGRPMRTEVELGPDYMNETMVVGARLYDSFGRVRFEADPFPMSQDSSTAYGTSYHFRPDGTPWCFVRGRGPQPLTIITDPPNEVFPTCYSRFFSGFSEFVTLRDPASLLTGSNQDGTIRYAELSALGRLVSRSTLRNGVRLEHATFSHDRLGQLTAMARYLDPATPANPVQTTWKYDSLGQATQWQEPESAAQSIIHSNWGEQLEVQWLDATVSPSVTRQVKNAYDALGRVTHREERNNGVTDPDSVFDYFYDVGTIVVPQVTPTHLVGRLARAKGVDRQCLPQLRPIRPGERAGVHRPAAHQVRREDRLPWGRRAASAAVLPSRQRLPAGASRLRLRLGGTPAHGQIHGRGRATGSLRRDADRRLWPRAFGEIRRQHYLFGQLG